MAEGSGADEALLMRDALGSMTMSELPGERSSDDGKNANANVICFGSIPALLDVSGRGDEGRLERTNLGQEEAVREESEGEMYHENGDDVRCERSLGEGCHANGVQEEVVCRRRREKKEASEEIVDGNGTVEKEAPSQNNSSGIDGSLSLGNGDAENGGSAHSKAVNGSLEVHKEVVDNGRGEAGSGEINSVVADVDCGESKANSVEDGERRNGVLSRMEKIARPLPPVLAAVDERSVTLSWMGCATMAVSYELDFACNEVSSKRVQNSEVDLKWTSVSCGEGLSYKVCVISVLLSCLSKSGLRVCLECSVQGIFRLLRP